MSQANGEAPTGAFLPLQITVIETPVLIAVARNTPSKHQDTTLSMADRLQTNRPPSTLWLSSKSNFPDITGSGLGVNDTTCNTFGGLKGAFYQAGSGSGKGNATWGCINVAFDVKRLNTTYGKSNTCQPAAIQALMIIKI